jgi:UDP-N-acetylglucosamine 2-epimerase (non-hydrolysing)
MYRLLGNAPAIELCPPCSHGEMLEAMLDSDLVLSDSGGMQEEAPILGVPLLVLRDRTERPEAIASGNIALVGTNANRIVAAVKDLLADPLRLARMSSPSLPFGDGRAAERIADIIAEKVGLPSRSRAA